jgi:SAM-dependent methyltransferase
MNTKSEKEWFASWFDTSYYHVLYQHRNDEEARGFIHKLVDFLCVPTGAKVLDLACGKGRHAVTLHDCGLDVLGLDLSEQSIMAAKQMEKNGLQFDVHDMRNCYQENTFDCVFNLFTSFGYFDDTQDNLRVIDAVHQTLKPNGLFVIDFLNANKVVAELVKEEVKSLDGITFHITREFDGKHIFKHIHFVDNAQEYNFTERVQALTLTDFKHLLSAQFDLLHVFGDYDLSDFNPDDSPRLILIAKRKD